MKDVCPVTRKFMETAGELPIPEAYIGSPKAKFLIVGINPGMTYVRNEEAKEPVSLWAWEMRDVSPTDFDRYIEIYIDKIEDYLATFIRPSWQYRRVCKIFNYSPENDEVMITNLVLCPSEGWDRVFSQEEQNRAFMYCNKFCRDIIKKVNPELILLHGLPVVKFYSRLFGLNVQKKDLPIKKEIDGRTYVLSHHLQSLHSPRLQAYWKKFEEIAKNLRRTNIR